MPLDTAAIMSTVLEGILYGFSVLMFIGTIWTFTYKKHMRDVNRPVATVAVLLFLASTTHMVVVIIRIEDGLVKYRDTFPGGPAAFFADNKQEMFVSCQTLLGDGVVIYRCYVVWQSVRVIILPCHDVVDAENLFTDETGRWAAAFVTFTFATNLFSSGLLAYRIWTIERKVSTSRTRKGIMPILRVLSNCAALICFARSNNGIYVIGDIVIPLLTPIIKNR
ncbi:hypothetical protein EDB19DRAFT_1719744 [Suillus lakei]|nr:hypothetical protein EDB19DRAFT_1719744 [Suillus lakei]